MGLFIMRELGLDLNLYIGVRTDNCSVMTSDMVGAVKEVTNQTKYACSVVSVRNAIGIMKSTISFFNMSAKKIL